MKEKPLPQPLYCCSECCDDHTWPAEDLFWSEALSGWCCDDCWPEVHGHWNGDELSKFGISLKEELVRRGLYR